MTATTRRAPGSSLARGLARREFLHKGLAAGASMAVGHWGVAPLWAQSAPVVRKDFDSLKQRATALGIEVPGLPETKALNAVPRVQLRARADLVDAALEKSQSGVADAEQLAADAGALLSGLNQLVRQPHAEEETKGRSGNFAAIKDEYRKMFAACKPDPKHRGELQAWAAKLSSPTSRKRYAELEAATKVPWHVIAVIHYRECSANFMAHLHNGDPLGAKTVHVPKQRPASWNPPPDPWNPLAAWQLSGVDALSYDGLAGQTDWSIERALFRLEAYNGWGTRNHGVIPNYLWNFSQYPVRGGYDSDGHWKSTYVSSQCGAAVLLRLFADQGLVSV